MLVRFLFFNREDKSNKSTTSLSNSNSLTPSKFWGSNFLPFFLFLHHICFFCTATQWPSPQNSPLSLLSTPRATAVYVATTCVFFPPLFTWDMYTRPTLIQLIEANLLEDISSPHRPHEGLNVYSVTQVSPHWCVILVWLIFPAASLYCLSGVVATCPAGEGVTDVFHIRNVIKDGKYWSSFSGFTAATTFQAGTYSWNTQLKWKRLTTFCHEEDMKRFLCLEHVFYVHGYGYDL